MAVSMKFLHCSDLHLGRKLHGYSMIDDQKLILAQLCGIAKRQNVDAVLIAGDVYDTALPNEDAVNLLDRFLTDLSSFCKVYMIAGNHDSAERLSFAKNIISRQGIYVTGRYDGKAEKFTVEDSAGPLNIFILPYTKTSIVRKWCRDNGKDTKSIETPDAAFSLTLENSGIDPSERNVLVAHEFVVGKGIQLKRCESELTVLPEVGGADCISSELLESFDYVALGHIHRPQRAGRDTVLYCGSPLKYSESELDDEKHAVIVDVGAKGDVKTEFIPLRPWREMIKLRGTVEEILAQADEHGGKYLIAEVTERADSVTERLRERYLVIDVKREYENAAADFTKIEASLDEIKSTPPGDLFRKFFREVTGNDLAPVQNKTLDEAVDRIGGGAE